MSRTASGRGPRMIALLATVIALVGFTLVGTNPASAEAKLSVGDEVTFSDGSPAPGVKVDVFQAASRWQRGQYLGTATTDEHGQYSFGVDRGCYFTVAIAPLGTEFERVGSGQVYDRQFGCVEGEPNSGFDSVLYREDVKPPVTQPPTTQPPTTQPPTTQPPVTHPPTTQPPTTLPPTTKPPAPVCDAEVEASWERYGVLGGAFGNDPSNIKLRFALRFDPSVLSPGLTKGQFQSVDTSEIEEVIVQYGNDLDINTYPVSNYPLLHTKVRVASATNPGGNPLERVDLTYRFAGRDYLLCVTTDFTNRITRVSPIGLDVDGSGAVERVNAEVSFDFNADGNAETVTEWFAPTEGILFDTRIAGPISGAHLFGDQGGLYSDGFEKLSLLDANNDGQVMGAELDSLAVWTDANTNGVLDAGERSSMADHQVVALSTSHSNFVSQAVLADGSTMVTEDLWFPLGPVPANSNPVALVGLGLAGFALVGWSFAAGRRRRNGLDQELIELTSESLTGR